MFYLFGKIEARDQSLSHDNLFYERKQERHCRTLKNTTFKNTYIGKLKKKIPLVKNIVRGAFFLPVLVQLLVKQCADRKCRSYGF